MALFCYSQASAQNTEWAGPAVADDVAWNNSTNWSHGLPVDYTSQARISNSTITLTTPTTGFSNILIGHVEDSVTTLNLSAATLTLTRTGGTANMNVGGGEYVRSDPDDPRSPYVLTGGVNSVAYLNITDGTQLDATTSNLNTPTVYRRDGVYLQIGGEEATSQGIAVIDGATTSVWASGVYVGSSAGTGTLTISGGAQVGSTYTYETGDPLTVQAGTMTIGGGITTSSAGTGAVTITGIGTQWYGASIEMGNGGSGSLIIDQGAQANTYSLEIGRNHNDWEGTVGNGIVRVSGLGSQLNVLKQEIRQGRQTYLKDGTVSLGITGQATLLLTDGGAFSNEGMVLLGMGKGQIYFNDFYPYDSHGIIQIGESGGQAGTFTATLVTTGYGSGEIHFNHGENDYTFSTLIQVGTPSLIPTGSAGRDEDGVLITQPGLLKVTVSEGGRTRLTGANTYTGGTVIQEGTLVAAHSTALGAGTVEVQAAGILEVAPELETVQLGNVVFSSGSTLKLTAAEDAAEAPRLEILGTLDFSTGSASPWHVALQLPTGFSGSQSFDWTFLTTTGGITGLDSISIQVDLLGWSVWQQGQNLVLSYVSVPEPSRIMLALMAMSLLLVRRHRHKPVL